MIERAVFSTGELHDAPVARARGREAMNELPSWSVDVLAADGALDLGAMVGGEASLSFADDDGAVRFVPLLVLAASYAGEGRDGHIYSFELSAPTAFLRLRQGYRIFQEKTTQEIVTAVLVDAGVSTQSISWRLSGDYVRRAQSVQYGESDWSYVARLLADDGIAFAHDSDADGGPLLVFSDAASSHEPISGPHVLRYEDASGMAGTASSFFSLECTVEMVHDAVHVRDYDIRQPDLLVEGRAGAGALEHYEYPAWVPREAADRRASVRLQQLQRLQRRLVGRSGCARFVPGHHLEIDGSTDEELAGSFLVAAVEHSLVQPSKNDARARPYRCEATLVPRESGTTFRPPLPRSQPRVSGVETAFVTGPRGEEIHVDELGRIKLSFPWDRSGIGDDRSSRWIRCAQMQASGSMLLPRVGWEVPVAYLDGCPDQPVCLGRVYNAGAVVPYGLPAKKATNTLMSATTPADGSANEVRWADDAGSMEFMVHASGDQSVGVGGSATTEVTVNETHDVGLNYGMSVVGTETVGVGGDQSVTVGTAANIKIAGSRSVTVGAMEHNKVTKDRHVDTGVYVEIVGGAYGLECNQSNTTINGGTFVQVIGGLMTITGACGTNEVVAGARLEKVGGSRNIVSAGATAERVFGVKRIAVGATELTSPANIVTEAASGSISAASTHIHASGTVVVAGDDVTLDLGSLSVSKGASYTMSGTHKASGSKLTVDSPTSKHQATVKATS